VIFVDKREDQCPLQREKIDKLSMTS